MVEEQGGEPCYVSRLRVEVSCKFIECYLGEKYLCTERGAGQDDGMFSFNIDLAPYGGAGGVSKFKFLRLNEPGALLVRKLQAETSRAFASGGDKNQSVGGLGKESTNSGIGDGSMLMTMVQMRLQMFEAKILSQIDQKLKIFQDATLLKLSDMERRLERLEETK